MEPSDLRIALFSGNYNYVRDGANQALNRLVGYLLRQGAHVRVYSPVVEHPAFPPTGDLVDVPSFAIPGRGEYRVPYALRGSGPARPGGVRAQRRPCLEPRHRCSPRGELARDRGIPVVASVHTRFETYLQYYRMQWLEPAVRAFSAAFTAAATRSSHRRSRPPRFFERNG